MNRPKQGADVMDELGAQISVAALADICWLTALAYCLGANPSKASQLLAVLKLFSIADGITTPFCAQISGEYNRHTGAYSTHFHYLHHWWCMSPSYLSSSLKAIRV